MCNTRHLLFHLVLWYSKYDNLYKLFGQMCLANVINLKYILLSCYYTSAVQGNDIKLFFTLSTHLEQG